MLESILPIGEKSCPLVESFTDESGLSILRLTHKPYNDSAILVED